MKNKVLKAILVVALIIALTISNFILVGMNLVYAVQSETDTTNHVNIKFYTYFKIGEEELPEAEYVIDDNEMKLYMRVSVENEGYFDGVITLEESNFNIKQDSVSEGISKIEGNTITLNRITAGKKVEIEVGIEPIINEEYEVKMLNMDSKVKLTGTYKDSTEEDIKIESEKTVALNLTVPNEVSTNLNSQVITNKVFKLGEENKRLIQVEINSKLENNRYPVKSSELEVIAIPGTEKVEVITQGTYATNGESERELLEDSDYIYDKEKNLVEISIKNEEKDGKISWRKNAEDIIIVTFILDEETEIPQEELNIKSKIILYGSDEKTVEKEAAYKVEEDVDGIIKSTVANEEKNMYKGKIYSKEEREYKTTTNIEVNYANLATNIELNQDTVYKTENEEEKASNIEYKTTTINKQEIEYVLGQEGSLTIKDQEGNIIRTITAIDETDEKGKIQIIHNEGVKGLKLEISTPEKTGIIRLEHTKVIKAENYSREEIRQLKTLSEKTTIKYNTPENKLASNTYLRDMSLRETITSAKLTVEPKILSTATINEQVKIGVTLRTDNEMFDLFKNPTIIIKLPDSVKSIKNITTNPLYLNELEIDTDSYKYDPTTKEITLKLIGEQTSYTGNNSQAYIQITADIELEETTPSKEDKITLSYTNENAVLYENEGKSEVQMNLQGPSGVVALHEITNYNVKGNSLTTESIQVGSLKMNQEAAEANFQIALVNNTGDKVENIQVIGNLPGQGSITLAESTLENTINSTLKGNINITAGTGTIYYTANKNATADLANSSNGWTTNLVEVINPTLYMIVIPSMEKETNFIANYTMNIPAGLEYNQQMETMYIVNYTENTGTKEVKSTTVGLETGRILATLEATVGENKLEDGAEVRAGEVIRYKIAVANNGSNDATNVRVIAPIPEGTIYVEPIENFLHTGEVYYKEIEKTNHEFNIPTLKGGESTELIYEVRVMKDSNGKTAQNQITIIYGSENTEIKSNQTSYNLLQGELRLTVKRVASEEKLVSGAVGNYFIIVENLSDTELKDIDVKLILSDEKLMTINSITDMEYNPVSLEGEWKISNIAPGEYKIYDIFLAVQEIEQYSEKVSISATAIHEGKTYRANSYNEQLYGFDVEIKMTSPNEGEYLKTDDVIEYNIEINNKSEVDMILMLVDTIPAELSISRIEVDGNLVEENVLDHRIYKSFEVKANTILKIKIVTVVNYDKGRFEDQTISNVAQLLYAGEEICHTEKISHILESIIESEPENPENPENPTDPAVPEAPTDPDEPINPDDPDNPDDPTIPEEPDNPDDPDIPVIGKYNITGRVWLDKDSDGELNNEDTPFENIEIKLLDVNKNEIVKDEENNKDIIINTDKEGVYTFTDIPEGKYIVVFEYDNTLYKPTIYEKSGVAESRNSNAISKTLTINGETKEYAATDEITINENIANIDLGLVFTKKFDIQVDKYVSKVLVQTSKGTITYDYQDKDFVKVEISPKQMVGATIIVQYSIKATNVGDVDAYINSLVDYAPTGLKFSSELNRDWYEVGGNLYTNSLANTPIAPGESKELTLTLTKTKTEATAELISNMAEIQEAYNIYGIEDINSVAGNENKDENDLGLANIIISPQTGGAASYIVLTISMIAIIGIAAYLINKKVLHANL